HRKRCHQPDDERRCHRQHRENESDAKTIKQRVAELIKDRQRPLHRGSLAADVEIECPLNSARPHSPSKTGVNALMESGDPVLWPSAQPLDSRFRGNERSVVRAGATNHFTSCRTARSSTSRSHTTPAPCCWPAPSWHRRRGSSSSPDRRSGLPS